MLTWWRSEVNCSFFLCLAACRMRSSACDTLTRSCARRVLCRSAFPLAPALGSTGSAADGSALFAGFPATMAGSDFPPPCIIGYDSSPSRCGPESSIASGQTRDLPASGALLLHVMCSSTPAGWQRLALSALHMLRSTFETASAPAAYIFRGSIRHPTQSLCMLRGRRCRRLTQHLLPGALLGLPGPVFHRLDCTSFGWRLLRNHIRRPRQACRTRCG